MHDFDHRRGSACKRGYGRRHERWRKMILGRDPLCKIAHFCRGLAPSTEADHIMPLAQGGDWSLKNGQGACHACHSYKTSLEKQAVRDGGTFSANRSAARTERVVTNA